MTTRCIIIGASHAAAQLSASLRLEGWLGEIVVIGDEPNLPYHRPPLSKAFLSGDKSKEDLLIRPQAFYDKNSIVFKAALVTSIEKEDQTVTLDSGESLHYDKLAICTGARVRKIVFPGSDLAGIHYLRNIADVERIQQATQKSKRVVIIGGGYIGLETASALNKMGMDVTVLEMASRILHRVTAPQLSSFYRRVHVEEGVKIHTNSVMAEMRGKAQVEEVICEDGSVYPADIVIIGIGVIPNIELAQQAGIETNDGIVVDKLCRTDAPNIYAAGDCTSFFNRDYGRRMRLESVPNASEQAKVVASSICGGSKEYVSLPWFWSDQYDLKLQIAGLNAGYDQVLIRGNSDNGRSFAAFYFKERKLIAADCVNRPQEFMLSKKIITQKLEVDPERLVNESIGVKELVLS